MNKVIEEDLERIYRCGIDWSRFFNCTVLISGANGFLPAYLIETLLYVNYKRPGADIKVIGLVRNLNNAKSRFASYLNNQHLKFIVQDVVDQIILNQRVDYIIHAASQASPKYYGVDPVGTLNANLTGTMNMLTLAKKNDVKSFLYFSSGEVYGDLPKHLIPIKEDTYGYVNPLEVRSCYAESKRMGENICISFGHQYGIPVRIVRPFHTYGPKMKLDDGRVYADFVSSVLNKKDIALNSDGSAIRAFCYLSDATIGFFKVLLEGENGAAYNVGNPMQEYSIRDLAEVIAGIYPQYNLKVVRLSSPGNNNYLRSATSIYSPDISKISLLGWKPEIDVKEGFRRTINSYYQN